MDGNNATMADKVYICNAPEPGAEDEINTVTHCADCRGPIRPLESASRAGGRVSRKNVVDYLDYCNLQAGKTTGICTCGDPPCTGRRSLRVYVVKRYRNGTEKRCWMVKDQQSSAQSKKFANDADNYVSNLILNHSTSSNQAMNNNTVNPSNVMPNAQNESWLANATKVAGMVSRSGKIVLNKFTSNFTALTARVEYTCPKCQQQKWSWQMAQGVPCLECMGFRDIRDSLHEEAEGISAAEQPDPNRILRLFTKFLRKFTLMRLLSLVIAYAPYFLMFGRYQCDESHDQINLENHSDIPTAPLLDPNNEENVGTHHNEPMQGRYVVCNDLETQDPV